MVVSVVAVSAVVRAVDHAVVTMVTMLVGVSVRVSSTVTVTVVASTVTGVAIVTVLLLELTRGRSEGMHQLLEVVTQAVAVRSLVVVVQCLVEAQLCVEAMVRL